MTADIADSVGMKCAQGALVVEPPPDSHAVKARDLAKQIGTMAPDSTIKLVVLRQGEEETMSVTLGELPNERQARASVEDHENAGDDATRLGLILTPAGKVMTAVAMGLLSPPSIPMVKQRGRI